jgi:hypothetical protein
MISVSIGSPPTRASDKTDTLSIVYNAFLCRTEEHSACMFIVSLGIKNCQRCGIALKSEPEKQRAAMWEFASVSPSKN